MILNYIALLLLLIQSWTGHCILAGNRLFDILYFMAGDFQAVYIVKELRKKYWIYLSQSNLGEKQLGSVLIS